VVAMAVARAGKRFDGLQLSFSSEVWCV